MMRMKPLANHEIITINAELKIKQSEIVAQLNKEKPHLSFEERNKEINKRMRKFNSKMLRKVLREHDEDAAR